MRIFNQRAAMIAPIIIMMNVILNETTGE
jgi:hypothetical protein